MHFVGVPQRERVMRYTRDLRALDCRDRRTADERILISIAAGHTPLRRDEAIQPDFVTVRTLTAGLQNSCRVVWIRRARVGAVLPVERSGERQVTPDVPLRSELVVCELLRFNLLRDRGEL